MDERRMSDQEILMVLHECASEDGACDKCLLCEEGRCQDRIMLAAADRIEELAKQLEQAEAHNRAVSALPNCNDCMDVKACAYRPQWGDLVRFNCPLWRGPAVENGGASNE